MRTMHLWFRCNRKKEASKHRKIYQLPAAWKRGKLLTEYAWAVRKILRDLLWLFYKLRFKRRNSSWWPAKWLIKYLIKVLFFSRNNSQVCVFFRFQTNCVSFRPTFVRMQNANSMASFCFTELNKKPTEGFSAGLIDDENLYKWELMVVGPADTF